MNRRASRTVGTARTASTGLTATTTVMRMPRSIWAKSMSSASRFSATSATRAAGSESLAAVTIRTLCSSQPVTSATATAAIQVRTCIPVPGVLPAKDGGMAWNTSDAAPYARPIVAAVNTRRWTAPRCTRHWVRTSSGAGITMAYTGGSRTATGSTHALRKSRTRPLCR